MKTTISILVLFCSFSIAAAQPPSFGGHIEWKPVPEKFLEAAVDKHKALADAPVIRQPIPKKTVGPVYPFEAARGQMSGSVRVIALVNQKGRVTKMEVIESMPKGVFDDATKAALKEWRFNKEMKEKVPIQYVVDYVFTYQPH